MRICLDVDWQKHEVCLSEPPGSFLTVVWTLQLVNSAFTVSGDGSMALTLTVDQQCTLSVSFADDHGNPAPVDGIPVWNVSDPTLITFTANADGMGGLLFPVGPVGTAQVTVSADADLGAGVVNITGILDVTMVAGAAANVVITAGTPVPKP